MNLKLKKLLAKLLSTTLIVETGTSGIWSYRKFSDGTYDAWLAGNANLAAGTAWGGFYFHATTSAYSPPSFSKSVTCIKGAPGGAQLCFFAGSTANYQLYFVNAVAGTSSNIPIIVELKGRWK